MTFQISADSPRIYDPERGVELVVEGSGSDGSWRFTLMGPNVEYHFSANSFDEKLSVEELYRLGADASASPIVWCIHNWTDELRTTIRDAVIAYEKKLFEAASGWFGMANDLNIFIRFGLRESVFVA